MGDATAPPGYPTGGGGGFAPPPGTWDQVLALPMGNHGLAENFLLVVAGQAFPRMLGPYQAAVEQWTNARRRTKAAGKDADVSALRLQVDEMQSVLAESRQETAAVRRELRAVHRELRESRDEARSYERRHDDVLGAHAVWDRHMIQLVTNLGAAPLPLPPLWPEPRPAPPAADGDVDEATTHP